MHKRRTGRKQEAMMRYTTHQRCWGKGENIYNIITLPAIYIAYCAPTQQINAPLREEGRRLEGRRCGTTAGEAGREGERRRDLHGLISSLVYIYIYIYI